MRSMLQSTNQVDAVMTSRGGCRLQLLLLRLLRLRLLRCCNVAVALLPMVPDGKGVMDASLVERFELIPSLVWLYTYVAYTYVLHTLPSYFANERGGLLSVVSTSRGGTLHLLCIGNIVSFIRRSVSVVSCCESVRTT